MSDTVITAEGLGKSYIIGHQQQERYVALRDVLANTARQWWSHLRNPQHHTHANQEEFWALKDVNFEIKQGDRVGIIGRNGAGKSTLLKVLSRITEPTTGRVSIKGRVASLLEVGTGFHPELTGRENIYLNGAILGMARSEIKKKFDEIVAFAEVEKFLDTPVKRYSSGMYVRLAFAVAAHLEPEILVVDEVLAVGDAQFQKKCLGKMEEVGREGRTVLFVSHNMSTIASLCERCLLLNTGNLIKQGKASDVILDYYSGGLASPANFDYSSQKTAPGDGKVKLLSGSVLNPQGDICSDVEITQQINILMKYEIIQAEACTYAPNFHFHVADGTYAFISGPEQMLRHTAPGCYEAICHIPGNYLNEGTYYVDLALTTYPGVNVRFYDQQCLSFNVRDPIESVPTRGGSGGYAGPIPGVVRPLLKWDVRRLE